MRKFKSKATAIVISVVLFVVLVLGLVFSFCPVTSGYNTFVSFSGSLNISSEISGGMYGEFDITTENPSRATLVSSMNKITTVFEELGYMNVNVYAVGSSKIRVEVSYPRGSKTYAEVYNELSIISEGTFFLSDANDASSSTVSVNGSDCVSEVKVYTNNSTKYISIIFNKKGQELYEELCDTTETIYLHLGSYAQSITASGVTDYTSFTLSDTDYANLVALEQRVIIGCMGIEVNSDTAVIETMSANLTAGASSQEESGFTFSSSLIILVASFAAVLIILLAFFFIKFGAFGVLTLISILFNVVLFLILMNLMPSVEIGIAGIMSLILGVAFIYTGTYVFASRVKSEYNLGKSFSAALETAYKKTLPNSIISNVTVFLASLIFFAFAYGEMTSAAIIFAICAGLSIFTNLLFIPLLIKLAISVSNVGVKLFKLKKRAIGFEEIELPEEAKANED